MRFQMQHSIRLPDAVSWKLFQDILIYDLGDTIGFPDSAMGITFLAAGGSVPEAVALLVVARQGTSN